MTILVTGAAGFIGFHVTWALLQRGENVIGIDSLNNYYDINLKQARLALLTQHTNFQFTQLDLSVTPDTIQFFQNNPSICKVIHLAAQAGVRYSLTHPFAYVNANVTGHLAVLEGCRRLPNLQHLVYASSSSIYGSNTKLPFAAGDRTDHPISLYAATKKSCELMSDCYAHLYNLPSSGLRFFTVYGPWGRPDMSAFIFTKAICENKAITIFNHGKMRRNFTYIDDIVEGTLGCLDRQLSTDDGQLPHRIYNIGNDKSEELMAFVTTLERIIGKTAVKNFEGMQLGDVPETIADIYESQRDFQFNPRTNIDEGLSKFVAWFREYYNC